MPGYGTSPARVCIDCAAIFHVPSYSRIKRCNPCTLAYRAQHEVKPPEKVLPCRECGKNFGQPEYSRQTRCWQCRRTFSEQRVPPTVEERFWSFVDKNGPVPEHVPELGQCWVWTGNRDRRGGYGRFKAEMDRPVMAHRFSWELANGPIPEGLSAMHRCDNPPCIRPDHLMLGTSLDNNHDMIEKGRQRYTGPKNPARGERHGMSKLTEALVEQIHAFRAEGKSQQAIATIVGVSQVRVSQVLRGHGWVKERSSGSED